MKRVLVVVDYQNDFVDGSLGFAGAVAIEDAIVQKIQAYQTAQDTVVFTFDTHDEYYLTTQEGSRLPVEHCVRESDGWKLYGKVASYLNEGTPCFIKGTFGSEKLACYLARQQFDSVELVGLVSNICVLANAVLAKTALPEAEIVVDAACTASADANLHEKALDVMEGLQITILNR